MPLLGSVALGRTPFPWLHSALFSAKRWWFAATAGVVAFSYMGRKLLPGTSEVLESEKTLSFETDEDSLFSTSVFLSESGNSHNLDFNPTGELEVL